MFCFLFRISNDCPLNDRRRVCKGGSCVKPRQDFGIWEAMALFGWKILALITDMFICNHHHHPSLKGRSKRYPCYLLIFTRFDPFFPLSFDRTSRASTIWPLGQENLKCAGWAHPRVGSAGREEVYSFFIWSNLAWWNIIYNVARFCFWLRKSSWLFLEFMGGIPTKYSIFQPTILVLRVMYSNILSMSSKSLGFIYHLQVGSNEIVGVLRQIPQHPRNHSEPYVSYVLLIEKWKFQISFWRC